MINLFELFVEMMLSASSIAQVLTVNMDASFGRHFFWIQPKRSIVLGYTYPRCLKGFIAERQRCLIWVSTENTER